MKVSVVFGLSLVLLLSGCKDATRSHLEDLFKDRDVTILEISPTVEKEVNGQKYQVAKARIKGKNGFGALIEETIGYLYDPEAGYYYSIPLDSFEKFLKTGDKSLLPDIRKPLSVD